MAAAYTGCHLTSTEQNTGFDVLSCASTNARIVNERTNPLKPPSHCGTHLL
jgi:hypothetical protein